ncbi:MAG: efflux RND transporter permease subunit [Armatimonadota bacterium]|nr:efflux RND transporter permease subunit [Armatimonadota bacterium]
MSPPALAVARPIGTCILFSVVVLLGLTALAGLPIDLLPEVSLPRLSVSTQYPGAGPEEVENLVSRVIEEAASTVPGAQEVISTSSQGASSVVVLFPNGTDLNAAADDLRAAVERARRRLPDGASPPIVFKFDPSQQPIMQMGLIAREGSNLDSAELRRLADEQVLFRLERVPGVALAEVRGGRRRHIQVALDRDRMQALRISERDVATALAAANIAAPAGEVLEGTRQLGLRVLSRYRDLDQIRNTVVAYRGGAPIHVRDVAEVAAGQEEDTGRIRINGVPGVLLQVQRQPGRNTVAVSDGVLRQVEQLNATLPGARIVVVADNARFIRSALASVRNALLLGTIFAVAVLLFFLRDVRSVLVIGTAIPISILAACALMFFSGYTLNLMTMGALALGVGMLVDTSIVVLENIYRHREAGCAGPEAAVRGAREVASAVTASTLTTIVVFLPVIFLRGGAVVTQMFFQFSMVVIFALLCSLAVSLTLTPVLASWLPALHAAGSDSTRSGRLVTAYRSLLDWALRHRAAVFAAALAVFLIGLGASRLVGSEILPASDEGEIFVSAVLPVGTRLDLTEQTLRGLEQAAREAAPEIVDSTLAVGSAGFGTGTHRGSLRLRLLPKGERSRTTEQIASVLRQRLRVPGGRVMVRASAGALGILRFGSSADPISVDIRGFDLDAGMRLAEQVRDALEQVPGVTDASVAREERIPEMAVRVDVERAAAFGLTPQQVGDVLSAAVAGRTATILREGGREMDVVVRLREDDRRTAADLLSVPITATGGRQILLGQVAEVVRGVAPAQIFRRGRERVITVSAGLSGRDFGSAMEEVRARIAQISLPPGFAIAFGEQYEEQQRANRQLLLGFGVAVLLVYAVMAIQFERLVQPLLIMGAVPFAVAGSLLMLWLTQTTLNVQSWIGIIVLAGIVVNNAIVLVDFILSKHRGEGTPPRQAAVEASAARLRPVLMTTLTTVLALVPVAIGLGEGAELQAPLARSVIGGMLLSALVTLVFIPTLYVAVEERRERRPAPQPAWAPVAGGSVPIDDGRSARAAGSPTTDPTGASASGDA